MDIRLQAESGIGRYIRELTGRFSPEISECFENIHLWSYAKDAEQACGRIPGGRVVPVTGRIYSLREQWERMVRDSDATIWTPHYNLPVFSRGKQVVTVHDLAHLALPEVFGRGLKCCYTRIMMQSVRIRAHRIIFISEFTKSEFERLIGPVHEERCRVIHNGVSPFWFESFEDGLRKNWLYVGNIKPHKNLKRTLLAFDSIKDRISGDFIIVGKQDGFITGESLAPILQRMDSRRIRFTGVIDDHALRDLYRRSKALVFPSIYEGFGLPVLEAMACGCPVISSFTASLAEIIEIPFCSKTGIGNAIAIDPHDSDSIANAFVEFSKLSKHSLASLRENALRQAHNFSWDKAAKKTLKIIRE